ncbi:MAG: DUF480 domain-containing protein [Planctomycetaceae bacterium]|nr:DUF480 domain-containing protein [Planctomycetaceae bacterium]
MTNQTEEKLTEFPVLNRHQRRVLGVLIEKGMTTPEYYPLTLKAVTTGCNQKSNRDPVTNMDEESVLDTLEELREMGFTGTVHTDGGRAERYRHYVRHRFDLSEAQIAILGELLLRGRQQLGELRSRASRMVTIESLDQLREELTGLMQMGAVRASGDLKRRGIEVDHGLYLDKEPESQFGADVATAQASASESNVPESPSSLATPPLPTSPVSNVPTDALWEASHQQLQDENRELRDRVDRLEETVQELSTQLADLKQQLGA